MPQPDMLHHLLSESPISHLVLPPTNVNANGNNFSGKGVSKIHEDGGLFVATPVGTVFSHHEHTATSNQG
ncbi:MAG: hypothetical protein K5657_04425 [Desulfovibrio sp.]|nr:hypothetical protein [Desulfovibrio sp.]